MGAAGRVTSTSSPRRWWRAAPVTRPRRRSRRRGAGPARAAKWTSLFCPVRPVITDGSRLDGPSTTTSSTRADAGPVPGQGRALDDGPQPLETVGHHLGGHEPVLHGRGPGPGPGREDEGVGAVVAGLGRDLERALEVVLGLARESHDEVGGDGQVGDGRPGPRPGAPGTARRCSPRRMAARTASLPDCSGQVEVVADLRRSRPWRRWSRAGGPSGGGW